MGDARTRRGRLAGKKSKKNTMQVSRAKQSPHTPNDDPMRPPIPYCIYQLAVCGQQSTTDVTPLPLPCKKRRDIWTLCTPHTCSKSARDSREMRTGMYIFRNVPRHRMLLWIVMPVDTTSDWQRLASPGLSVKPPMKTPGQS